jgi:hypothetical protein
MPLVVVGYRLLPPRSKWINDGMLTDLVLKSVGPDLAAFKKKHGMEYEA